MQVEAEFIFALNHLCTLKISYLYISTITVKDCLYICQQLAPRLLRGKLPFPTNYCSDFHDLSSSKNLLRETRVALLENK